MQEDNNIINPEIKITVSEGNITYSSDFDPQATVFWLETIKALIISRAMTNE